MPSTVIQIDKAEVRFGSKPQSGQPINPLTLTDYSCQVTRAEITATSNTTTATVPATFCGPASEASVPVASTFQLNLDSLQDWTVTQGLSAFLFKNDATEVAFALYLQGADEPSATGVVVCQAGGFGGTPGEPLVSTVTLNIQGYPDIKDPDGNSLRNPDVYADPLDLTYETFGATAPADLTDLKADPVYGDGNFTGATFTTGQYVTLGDNSTAHWDALIWTAGSFP